MKIILDEYVKTKWTNGNKVHFTNKGYKFTANNDEVVVKVEDLQNGSGVGVSVQCPNCKKSRTVPFRVINKYGNTFCANCRHGATKTILDKGTYLEVSVKTKSKEFSFLIDKEDVEFLDKFSPVLSGNGYINLKKDGKPYPLHRLIVNVTGRFDVDHINRNKLDNRKENLRVVTHQQNSMNCSLAKNNTSGFTGVIWDRFRNKWKGQISINKKNVSRCFNTKKEAIEWRKQKEQEFWNKQ